MAKVIEKYHTVSQIREHTDVELFDSRTARWQDPENLAAFEEVEQIIANPSAYKSYKSVAELIADCLDGDDDDD